MSENNNLSFCVVSCLHFGGLMRGWNSYKDTYALMSHVASLQPGLLILNGSEVDLRLMGTDSLAVEDNQFLRPAAASVHYIENTRRIMDQMAGAASKSIYYLPSENSVPLYMVDNGNPAPALTAEANKAFLRRAPGRYYTFEQGNCFFICLDSEAEPENRGLISADQLMFLQKAAERAKAFPHVF
ncbi:MAG: hypothetical protein JRC92_10745, partial [Deltaproteobacteria bacterium]|nr:hypothetical protein [Deltaproteobacteria bacterium]